MMWRSVRSSRCTTAAAKPESVNSWPSAITISAAATTPLSDFVRYRANTMTTRNWPMPWEPKPEARPDHPAERVTRGVAGRTRCVSGAGVGGPSVPGRSFERPLTHGIALRCSISAETSAIARKIQRCR